MALLLAIPKDCKLAVIFATRERGSCNRKILRDLLLLCKEISQFVLANFNQIVAHYAYTDGFGINAKQMFCGRMHSINDQPASFVEKTNGKIWYRHGKIHREGSEISGMPAMISDTEWKWYHNGVLHRENDLPAVMNLNGTCEWWVNGKCHRDTIINGQIQPAIIWGDGSREWWQNGKLHRDGGLPAIDYCDTALEKCHSSYRFPYEFTVLVSAGQEWWVNGKRHRNTMAFNIPERDNLPAIVHKSGRCEWWVYGHLHRSGDQPAITDPNGLRAWWVDGWLHRDNNKPAIIHPDGRKEIWRRGIMYE